MSVRPARPAGEQEPRGLAVFNRLPAEAARQALLSCCSTPRWAAAVAAGRPYPGVAGLLRQSDQAVDGLAPADLRDALAGHPRIGERNDSGADGGADGSTDGSTDGGADGGADGSTDGGADGSTDGSTDGGADSGADSGVDSWSRQEQAGVAGAAGSTRQALADGNAAYERRFGHIYLVCATGRSAGELLGLLEARLANDGETEWGVVRSELKKINRIRLGKLIGGAA